MRVFYIQGGFMSYIALYRKWRPLTFEDVVEQEHVVKTLRHSVNIGRIAHAYLFCGTRGTGKTTMAHILSRAINCLSPRNGDPCNECEICRGILSGSILDVLEIDAASNNSVDNIRDIRDEVVYTPSQAKYKVYIIDEVHMLSTGAFNALLKTLEEPPAHVVFILATTEPHKLPATILSRCQRFDFRRITIESIVGRLQHIVSSSGTLLHNEAARLIARMADGAMRDAISLLDQCISMGGQEITYQDVLSVIGLVNDTFIAETVDAILSKNITDLLRRVEQLVMDGKDISQFVSDLVLYYRNMMICKIAPNPGEIIDAPGEALDTMKKQSKGINLEQLTATIKELSALEGSLKWAAHPRILLEVALVRLCEDTFHPGNADIAERLAALERKLSSGDFTTKPAAVQVQETKPTTPVRESTAKASEVSRKPLQNNAPELPSHPKGKKLEAWSSVLNELKSGGRMVLYSNLITARAIEIDDRHVGIVFGPGASLPKMLVSKTENLEVLQGIISRLLGREIRIKCMDEESLTEAAKVSVSQEDELVEKAKDLAKKFNAPLNIIDE